MLGRRAERSDLVRSEAAAWRLALVSMPVGLLRGTLKELRELLDPLPDPLPDEVWLNLELRPRPPVT